MYQDFCWKLNKGSVLVLIGLIVSSCQAPITQEPVMTNDITAVVEPQDETVVLEQVVVSDPPVVSYDPPIITPEKTPKTNVLPPKLPTLKQAKSADQEASDDTTMVITSVPKKVRLRTRQTLLKQEKNTSLLVKERDLVKVGLLLPMSGTYQRLGAALFQAAELSLFHRVSTVELLLYDTKGTPEGAAVACRNALANGAQVLLGPVFSKNVEAVAPIARLADITVLSFTNDRRVAGGGVFILGLTPEEQVERVISYARRQGLESMAALVPDSSYGNKVLNAVNLSGEKYGIQLQSIVQYSPDAKALDSHMQEAVQNVARYADRQKIWREVVAEVKKKIEQDPTNEALNEQLEALKKVNTVTKVEYQILVVAEFGERLREVSALLPYYDVYPGDVQLINTGWVEPHLGLEPGLDGAWFAGPSLSPGEFFRQSYEAAYDAPPLNIAMLMYDAVALVAALSSLENVNFNRETLTSENGFLGSQGLFRLLPSGVAQHSLSVFKLSRKRLVELDASENNFSNVP